MEVDLKFVFEPFNDDYETYDEFDSDKNKFIKELKS